MANKIISPPDEKILLILPNKLRIHKSIIQKSIYSFTLSYISDLIKKRTILTFLRYQNAHLLISLNSSKTSLHSIALKIPVPHYVIPSLVLCVLLDSTKDVQILLIIFSPPLIIKSNH